MSKFLVAIGHLVKFRLSFVHITNNASSAHLLGAIVHGRLQVRLLMEVRVNGIKDVSIC